MKRILVVLPNWFGETLFATPFLRALRQARPEAFIATLGWPRCREVLTHNPRVNELIDYDEAGTHGSLAGIWRLVRQLFAESALLSVVGGASGLLVARWGIGALLAISPDAVLIPRLDQITIDSRVFGFAAVTSLFTALLFGVAPALYGSSPDLNASLKAGGRRISSRSGRYRGRSTLVVTEVALALVLLAGAGLMLNTFRQLQRLDLGFSAHDALTMHLELPRQKYAEASGLGTSELTSRFVRWVVRPEHADLVYGVLERLEALPEVESAAAINYLPLNGGWWDTQFTTRGDEAVDPPEPQRATLRPMTSDYFRTIGIPLLVRRHFTPQDDEGAPEVAIVNETFARRFWPGDDPLGKRITTRDGLEDEERNFEVVGVVADVREAQFRWWEMGREQINAIYIPYRQQAEAYVDWQIGFRMRVSFVLRSAAEPANLAPLMRAAVWELDDDQPIQNIVTMEQLVAETLAERRFYTLVLSSFSTLAMILAAVGVYGLLSFTVSRQTHEIGVRMALGANQRDVLRMVAGHGLRLSVLGVAIGIAAAIALTRLLATWLYAVSPTDPLTYAGVSLLMVAAALLACFLPTRRATRVDPMVTLRTD